MSAFMCSERHLTVLAAYAVRRCYDALPMKAALLGAIMALSERDTVAVHEALAEWLQNELDNADPDADATETMRERATVVAAVVAACEAAT